MIKQSLIGLFFLTSATYLSAQEIKIGGDWSSYNYSYFCPSYSFSENGRKGKKLDILDHNHISLADRDYLTALDSAENYIKKRGGLDFFSRIDLYDIDITYVDSVEQFKNKRPLFDLEKCGKTKYFFRFHYKNGRNINYRFGVALSDKNEIISEHNFPNQHSNSEFLKIISPNEIFKLAKKYEGNPDSRFDSIKFSTLQSIKLEYDDKNDCFIWELTPEVESSDKAYKVLIMNAVTGELIEDDDKIIITNKSH